MAKKNFGEGPMKSIQEWAEEQLYCDSVEMFIDACEGDEEDRHKSTDPISLDGFLGLRKKYGF